MIRSLQGRLILSLTAMIVVTGVIAGMVAFRWAFEEAIELQDSILLQVGNIAGNIRVPAPAPAGGNLEPEAQVMIEEEPAIQLLVPEFLLNCGEVHKGNHKSISGGGRRFGVWPGQAKAYPTRLTFPSRYSILLGYD